MESKVVCRICFAWKEQERHPILTQESQAVYDPGRKVWICPLCKQDWSAIRVAKEVIGRARSRWVRIRQRPRISAEVDYKVCKNLPNCTKGLQCNHAHSHTELLVWVKERAEQEPRPPPILPPPPNNGPRHYHRNEGARKRRESGRSRHAAQTVSERQATSQWKSTRKRGAETP